MIVDGEGKVERVGPFGASGPASYARPVWEGYGVVMEEGVSWCAETMPSLIYHAYEAGRLTLRCWRISPLIRA